VRRSRYPLPAEQRYDHAEQLPHGERWQLSVLWPSPQWDCERTPEDFDFEWRLLTVHTNGGRIYPLPLPDNVL
jgi:hypothetical protein